MMMITKTILVNCSSDVASFLRKEYSQLGLEACATMEEAKERCSGPSLILTGLDIVDFDLNSLLASESPCALVELSKKSSGFGLHKGEICELDDLNSPYVDSFQTMGAFCVSTSLQIDKLTNPVGVKALVSGRTGKQYSAKDYKKALYLDRDGILNHDGGYLYQFEKMAFYNEIIPLLKMFQDNEYSIFVVTNQSGIARGYYSERDVQVLHEKMSSYFLSHGVKIEHFYYSAHHREKGEGIYKATSFTRKPWPGMISLSMKDFPITLIDSVMIGDKKSDDLMGYSGQVCHVQRGHDLNGAIAPIFKNYDQLKMFLATRFFKGQN